MTVCVYLQKSINFSQTAMYRYMGCPALKISPELTSLCREVAAQVRSACSCKVCYAEFSVSTSDDVVHFASWQSIHSASLAKNLEGCTHACIFCATVGTGVDRGIAANRISPVKEVLWDAAGTAAIEQLCDDFCAMLSTPQRPRFSPGYGDLALAIQGEILSLLDADRRIGVGLTESFLMAPAKSVTAIVGIK